MLVVGSIAFAVACGACAASLLLAFAACAARVGSAAAQASATVAQLRAMVAEVTRAFLIVMARNLKHLRAPRTAMWPHLPPARSA